jgi:hypothetical protein
MVEYPRALRIAHHIVYFHAADARSHVDAKIAEAVQLGDDAQADDWQKVRHFVDRLLDESPEPAPSPHHRRAPPRYRRTRADRHRAR